jgi:hypothetical protein
MPPPFRSVPIRVRAEGIGFLGPVAFSSLTATWEWLQRPEATRFMRAYRQAREWVNATAGEEGVAAASWRARAPELYALGRRAL